MPTVIYVICCQCEDSYYPGHIYCHNGKFVAFTDKNKAQAYIDKLNGPDLPDDDDYPWFYINEVELQS